MRDLVNSVEREKNLTMSGCNQNNSAVDTLVDYCADTLDAAAAEAVEKHLLECPACDGLVKAQRSAWAALDEWQTPAVSDDFDARLYRRIEASKQAGWVRRSWNAIAQGGFSPAWKPAIPLGVATLVLAAGFLLRSPAPILSTVQPVGPGVEAVTTSSAQTVDVDQIESALDDLDMLTPMSRGGAI